MKLFQSWRKIDVMLETVFIIKAIEILSQPVTFKVIDAILSLFPINNKTFIDALKQFVPLIQHLWNKITIVNIVFCHLFPSA